MGGMGHASGPCGTPTTHALVSILIGLLVGIAVTMFLTYNMSTQTHAHLFTPTVAASVVPSYAGLTAVAAPRGTGADMGVLGSMPSVARLPSDHHVQNQFQRSTLQLGITHPHHWGQVFSLLCTVIGSFWAGCLVARRLQQSSQPEVVMAAISSEHETQDDTDTFSRRQAAQVLATTMAVPLGAAHAESYIKKAGMKGQTNLDVADYTMTASGVQIKKAKEGKGDRTVKDGDTVTVDMTGRLAGKNGLYFIKTTEADGEPITLRLGPGLIPGLREGIEGMKLQEIRRIVVPEELGYTEPLTFPGPQPDPERTDYRERLQSVVNSNSRDGTLVFDVKVVNIR